MNSNTDTERYFYVDLRIDDLPLTVEAFRVYVHLCLLVQVKGTRYMPSWEAIANKCLRSSFPQTSATVLNHKAHQAVIDLIRMGLIDYLPGSTRWEDSFRLLGSEECRPGKEQVIPRFP